MASEGIKERKRNLTSKEIDVLKLLYRFRFATNAHLAAAQDVHAHSARLRAARLVAMGYLLQLRDDQAIIDRQPGVYVLSAKAATFLHKQDEAKYSKRVLSTIVASKNAKREFIERNLMIFSLYNRLSALYGSEVVFLTKSTLSAEKFDYLPEVRPDVFLQLGDRHFFLYYLNEGQPDFAHVRRFKPLFDYATSGVWETETGLELPPVLFVAASKRLESFARRRFENMAVRLGSDLECATTTVERLMAEEKNAWIYDGEACDLAEL